MFHTKFVGKIGTQLFRSVTPLPRKSCRLWDSVENNGRVGLATVEG